MKTIRDDILKRMGDLRLDVTSVAKALHVCRGHFARYLRGGDMSTVHMDRLLRFLGYTYSRFGQSDGEKCRERILRAARVPESEWEKVYPPPATLKHERRRRTRGVMSTSLSLAEAEIFLRKFEACLAKCRETRFAEIVTMNEARTPLSIFINPRKDELDSLKDTLFKKSS
jgi:hypothetical protein